MEPIITISLWMKRYNNFYIFRAMLGNIDLFDGKIKNKFARTGTRTLDPQIKSLMLYRLSYPGSWYFIP